MANETRLFAGAGATAKESFTQNTHDAAAFERNCRIVVVSLFA